MNAAYRVVIASGVMFFILHGATRADTGFPQPYCQWSTSNVAPITHVDFAGIVNNSDDGSNAPSLENFRLVTGSVAAGEARGIYMEANTGGGFPPYPTRVAVFVDWNQDGDFDDSDEGFDLGWLQGSGSSASRSGTINVPVDVADGATRMRVVAAGTSNSYVPACGNADKGQAEDYTLSVAAEQATDGDLDTSFGYEGLALSGITDSGGLTGGMVVQPDGRIVLCAGSHTTSGSSGPDFFVARFTPDGILDSTFSFDGKVTIDFQQDTDFCRAVALQADGRIVVAGASRGAAGGSYDFSVARLNADGTLDTGFGAGSGKSLVAFDHGGSNNDVATAVAVQPDGRIVLAGWATGPTAGNRDMAIVRLLPDGVRDTTFNLSGRVLVGFEPNSSFESDDEAEAVAIDRQGRIVLAGGANSPDLGIAQDFAVVRLLPDGQLDPDFDADGRVTLGFDIVPGGYDFLRGLILDHAGRIVLVGRTNAGTPETANDDMAIARLLADGSPDSAFGIGGKAIVPFDLEPQGVDAAYAVAEQANGKLLLAGSAYGTHFDAALARVNQDGTLDAQFGSQGRETFDFLTPGGTQVFTNVALQGTAIIASGQLTPNNDSEVDNFVVRIDSGLIFADDFD